MKAFIVDRYGGPDVVRAGEMPDPVVRDDDVLVEVHAAGVNQLDTKIRAGEFKRILPYPFPFVLGNDLAGTVVRVGRRAKHFPPGDEVYARPDKDRIGTFAEFISVNETDLAAQAAIADHGRSRFGAPRRPDRVASPRRPSEPEARAEGPHPGRFRAGDLPPDGDPSVKEEGLAGVPLVD